MEGEGSTVCQGSFETDGEAGVATLQSNAPAVGLATLRVSGAPPALLRARMWPCHVALGCGGAEAEGSPCLACQARHGLARPAGRPGCVAGAWLIAGATAELTSRLLVGYALALAAGLAQEAPLPPELHATPESARGAGRTRRAEVRLVPVPGVRGLGTSECDSCLCLGTRSDSESATASASVLTDSAEVRARVRARGVGLRSGQACQVLCARKSAELDPMLLGAAGTLVACVVVACVVGGEPRRPRPRETPRSESWTVSDIPRAPGFQSQSSQYQRRASTRARTRLRSLTRVCAHAHVAQSRRLMR